MILVDIYVPSVNHTYDFRMDEKTSVGAVKEELVSLIEQKEHCMLAGSTDGLWLCSDETEYIFPDGKTLESCGIHSGSRLILV